MPNEFVGCPLGLGREEVAPPREFLKALGRLRPDVSSNGTYGHRASITSVRGMTGRMSPMPACR